MSEGRRPALSPPAGGVHRPHSGVARLAVSTGAPVIPVGIGLDRRRIHRLEAKVAGKPEVVTWYLHGPYALTVGRPLHFQGDVHDWACVRVASEQIMDRIAALARESDRRIAQASVPASQPGVHPVEAR